MSVAQENRWKKLLKDRNDSANFASAQIEAMSMVRNRTNAASYQKTPTVTRAKVRAWMRSAFGDYATATELSEAANVEFNLPNGAMDDPDHWVWEEAAKHYE